MSPLNEERIFLISCTTSWNSCTFRLILSSFGTGSGGIWIQDFTCVPLSGLTAKRCLYSGHGLHPFPVHRLHWYFRKGVLHSTASQEGVNFYLYTHSWQVDQEVRGNQVSHTCAQGSFPLWEVENGLTFFLETGFTHLPRLCLLF